MCSLRVLICSVAACCRHERITTPSRTATTGYCLGSHALAPSPCARQAPGRRSSPWWPKPLGHWPTPKLRASQKLSRQGKVLLGWSDLSVERRLPKDCECTKAGASSGKRICE